MLGWTRTQVKPQRVIDPGCGSGRFLVAAAREFPKATLIGVENDALAALIARANVSVLGLGDRAEIIQEDFRSFRSETNGRSLYVGNPPYVRHHRITSSWKKWLIDEAGKLGYSASALAGLHVYFILATVLNARPGDFGAFITAAEWLDVNYGALVRKLFLEELGGTGITVIEPTAQPFADAATTAAITTFVLGSRENKFYFKRVAKVQDIADLGQGKKVHRGRLEAAHRWSYLSSSASKPPQGFVELGELCRVHRGQVTGANGVWISGPHSENLPESVLHRSVTRAREVINANGLLSDSTPLRHIIDLPAHLDVLTAAERKLVEAFLKKARLMGAHRGYVATHRKAWWSVGLRTPAPIISTYMARRSPAFVLNKTQARHINIAHGLYPRVPLSDISTRNLVRFLQTNVSTKSGRTYAGGLTKFEPREMERVFVPDLSLLSEVGSA